LALPPNRPRAEIRKPPVIRRQRQFLNLRLRGEASCDRRKLEAFSRHLPRPVKQQITARLDSDVLHWLKSQGKGYQSRMNEILRKEMLAAMKR
jgi:uncharacterized protein (DUF4415 family)